MFGLLCVYVTLYGAYTIIKSPLSIFTPNIVIPTGGLNGDVMVDVSKVVSKYDKVSEEIAREEYGLRIDQPSSDINKERWTTLGDGHTWWLAKLDGDPRIAAILKSTYFLTREEEATLRILLCPLEEMISLGPQRESRIRGLIVDTIVDFTDRIPKTRVVVRK